MKPKVVVFGAGATGRGHVGLLAWQAGADLVFVDKKPKLVEALKLHGHYIVGLYGDPYEEVEVRGYRVLPLRGAPGGRKGNRGGSCRIDSRL